MKFREYDNIFPKILKGSTSEQLEQLIAEAATKFNMIDLQYSTTNIDSKMVEYSALLLLQK